MMYKKLQTSLRQLRLPAVSRTSFALSNSKPQQQNTHKVDLSDNQFLNKILQKTEQGRSLAKTVTLATPLDKFEREQRYQIFIDKMNKLYQSERRFQRKANQAYSRMRSSHLLYQTPVQQVLSEYNKLTGRGFNCEVLATSLQHLTKVIEARGNRPKVYADYTLSEMDQSWRMDKVASDISFALNQENNTFFSPHNMARTSRHLGELGYKNTELIENWLQVLPQIIKGENLNHTAAPDFESVVFGSFKNFKPRHYIFQGFESDQEFQSHLETLALFQQERIKSSRQTDENVKEVEEALSKLIEVSKEMRDVQVEQQAAIESLRSQYFKLQAAQNKHEFLSENKYLTFDMLELQEMLVKGGYLDPHEALVGQHDSLERKMERASSVFYELALNFNPELLSPQYNAFYEAATTQQQNNRLGNQTTETSEKKQLDISLGNLSDILVGLAEQSLSFRRDAKDKDYPNKFYEDLLMPEERRLENPGAGAVEKHLLSKFKAETVLMERSYLNAWRTFQKHSERIINDYFKNLLDQNCTSSDLLKALRALSACKLEAISLRDEITQRLLKSTDNLTASDCVDGLVGIANCSYKSPQTDQLVKHLLQTLNADQLSFKQQIDVLHAIAITSTSMKGLLKQSIFNKIMQNIDSLQFDRVDHELTYNQFEQLHDVYLTLKFVGRTGFQNPALLSSLETYKFFRARFQESSSGGYDPLKTRVVAGLASGFNAANLTNAKLSQDFDSIQNEFALQPDIVTGVDGQKTALYVLNNREIMSDSKHADGRTSHLLKLTKDVNAIGVALDSIIDYDLNSFKLKIREDFSLDKIISTNKTSTTSSIAKLANFAVKLTEDVHNRAFSPQLSQFIEQLAEFFNKKDRTDNLFETEQLIAANDELKLSLLKAQLIYQLKLKSVDQDTIERLSDFGFDKIVAEVRSELEQKSQALQEKLKSKLSSTNQFNFNWQGARQSMEMPITVLGVGQKSIYPELLSRKFLTRGDYHQYDDWKQLMQETFDQFNLMQVKEPEQSVNFDLSKQKRKIPKGIFPPSQGKRQILQQLGSNVPKNFNNHDQFVKFEADPFNEMLQKELQLSNTLKHITPETSLITNLQNIKYGLLADYSDEEICRTLLQRLSFTDSLIESHLQNQQAKNQNKPQFLLRDPAAFRKYQESQVKQQSPFNKFFLKEGLKQGRAKELYEQIAAKENRGDSEGAEILKKELDNILIKIDRENEDNFSLSKGLDNYVQVNVDLKSLGVLDSPDSIRVDPSVSDEEYLRKQRCQSESNLIKTKIIFKLHQNLELTEKEAQYLQVWRQAMQEPNTLISECLVPSEPSSQSLADLSPEDIYTLNSIPRVKVDREQHGKFALNDLVVELAQVFDSETIRQVEISCLQDKLRKEWNLQSDFKLVEQRNKEIDIVQEELEELAWRTSGQFTEKDIKAIKDMFLVGRGQDHYDRQYLSIDIQSLEQFIAAANPYDSRIELLEQWLCRKEFEIKNRTNLPTPELQKPDAELNSQIEAKYKPARERLISQMLVQDEFGVAKSQQKAYKHLSSNELNQLVEGICPRLNLFNRQYPQFLPQAVRAIMEHPNLTRSDRETLDTYCKMFELDWRADHAIKNKDELMATNPIYLHPHDKTSLVLNSPVSNEAVSEALTRASQPYLPSLVQKIMSYSSSR